MTQYKAFLVTHHIDKESDLKIAREALEKENEINSVINASVDKVLTEWCVKYNVDPNTVLR